MTARPFVWTSRAVRAALDPHTTSPVEGDRGAGAEDTRFSGVSTDTRTLGAGSLFVALVGPNFDGHDFLEEAAASGATGAVVSREVSAPEGMTLFRVEDTLLALGQLARYRRDALQVPVVGLTGSSGKTSTKEYLRAALGARYRVHATEANLNNRIGVPLTILSAPDDAEVLVVEMGTSIPGEIAALAAIGAPDISLVLTIGASHLEQLGSLQGVLEEKLDLVRGMRPGGTAIVGDTPGFLPERAREIQPDVRVAGLSHEAEDVFRPTHLKVDAQGRYSFRWQGVDVSLKAAGRHMAYNATLALAVAHLLEVDPVAACEAVSAVEAVGMRGEIRKVNGWTLLVDCYNANPQSMRAALDTLAAWSGQGSRVAILGTMLELGSHEAAFHDEVLQYALSLELDAVVATGRFASAAPGVTAAGLFREEDPEIALDALMERLGGNAVVLLKGSRGVRLERLIPRFEAAAASRGDVAGAPSPGEAAGEEEGEI
jgi:UDP-N-acetylmuramoyl-tripeptide--D-alanyl-D-alanine ligase